MTIEWQPLQGRVMVRVVDKQGQPVKYIVQANEIVDAGRELIAKLLVGAPDALPISHLAVGTDGTAPTPGDTALGAEITSIARAPIQVEALIEEIGMRVSAQVSSATNQAVSEAGLFNTSEPPETEEEEQSEVMYNRVAFPSPIPVGTDLDLIFEWDITF